jgi:hypothetical protein
MTTFRGVGLTRDLQDFGELHTIILHKEWNVVVGISLL